MRVREREGEREKSFRREIESNETVSMQKERGEIKTERIERKRLIYIEREKDRDREKKRKTEAEEERER